MKTITVVAQDRVGLLADMTYILSKAGVNIEGMCVDVISGKAIVAVEVKDLQKAGLVLEHNGFGIIPQETIILKVSQGDATGIEDLLKKQKIIVSNRSEISSNDHESIVALNVDKPRRATRLLSPFLFGNCNMQPEM